MQTMLAMFPDQTARDNAVKAAAEKRLQMLYVGSLSPVLNGKVSELVTHAIIVLANPTDALLFMQHGAGSCSII